MSALVCDSFGCCPKKFKKLSDGS